MIDPTEFSIPLDDDYRDIKIPPHSAGAESSVIAGLLLDQNQIQHVAERITPEMFYCRAHRVVYDAILAVSERQTVDVITVADHLQSSGELEQLGGMGWLAELVKSTGSTANIDAYCKVIADKAVSRDLIRRAAEITDMAYDGAPAEELVESAQSSILSINLESADEVGGINGALKQLVADIDERFNNPGQMVGLSTGFDDIDNRTQGLGAGDLVIVAGRPSMGKAQPLTAGVLMADGAWRSMGDVRVGDRLASVDGVPSVVTGVFPQGRRPIYRVTLSDGRAVEADSEHLWRVESSKWSSPRTVTTLKLQELLTRTRYRNRIRVARHNGMFGSGAIAGIDAWLLGFLLGDGCLTQSGVCFSSPEPYILERVRSATGREVISKGAVGCDYRIAHSKGVPHPLRRALEALGVSRARSYEKTLPAEVLGCDRATRQAVLAGLLESDGWVETSNAVQFCSSSEALADGVVALVRSLGGFARKRVRRAPAYSYRGEIRRGRDAHIVSLALDDLGDFIRSPRLLKNLRPRRKRASPVVASVEYSRMDEAQCIAVSHPSHLYITDGYTVTHNTTFAMNIVEHVAVRNGKPVLVFSMEMPRQSLMMRMAASVGGIPFGRVRTGQLVKSDWPKLSAAVGRIKDRPLYIDDRSALSVQQMARTARKLHQKVGLAMIAVDYMQLATDKASARNREQEVSAISRGLKAIAKELNIPLVALSQLNRGVEKAGDKRPQMSDLRDSGAIEQDADAIMMLYRDEYYHEDSPDKGIAEVITCKLRNGETGTDRLYARLEQCRFENLTRRSGYEDYPHAVGGGS